MEKRSDMMMEFKDQPELGLWRYRCEAHEAGYVWLAPTIDSHPALAILAEDGMIGVKRSLIRPHRLIQTESLFS